MEPFDTSKLRDVAACISQYTDMPDHMATTVGEAANEIERLQRGIRWLEVNSCMRTPAPDTIANYLEAKSQDNSGLDQLIKTIVEIIDYDIYKEMYVYQDQLDDYEQEEIDNIHETIKNQIKEFVNQKS